ncbi:MAG TPA: molybdopterin-dependent oxidoreductase [Saprospiraceae bacterium]|nr:molybdopterin-dependent oxidoreductase [Saprospiraceae bacterium]HNT20967.1 molybdopterin-dependent oxidoreductase [Saprospiraceae bacterium]
MNNKKEGRAHPMSRRQFMLTAGGFSFAVTAGAIAPRFLGDPEPAASSGDQQLTAWVKITADGKITIYNPAAEMGQGSMTALAAILAEEMDADWDKVTIEYSPVEPGIYGMQWNGTPGGPMITAGSRTVRGYYKPLRQAGAKARYVLLYNAAKKWGLPQSGLKTDRGYVIDPAGGRKLSYGEIASFAQIPPSVPEINEQDLKKPEQFRLIGQIIPRYDIPEKTTGRAKFGIDFSLPDMVYAAIARAPVYGSTPELLNENEVRTSDGLVDLVKMDHGIGVVANTFEQALKAKKRMQIRWSGEARAKGYDSVEDYKSLELLIRDENKKGRMVVDTGDAPSNIQSAYKIYEREYRTDYLYHAQMEPLNAVIHIAADGKSAEAWAGTQAPDTERNAIAKVLGLDESKVTFHNCYSGGGFGRRQEDFSLEAAMLAKQVRRPLKLIWTREDDIQYGAFRPMSLQRMEAGVDRDGHLTGWQHRIAGPDNRLQTGGVRMNYYTIPNQQTEHRVSHPGVRTAFWRSVGHGPNKFAQEAFIDEIAHDLQIDPYEYRRRMMKDLPRHLALLDKAAALSGWGKSPAPGRAYGMAFSDYGGSYTSGVVEISLDQESGQIKVHKVWAAVDAGVVVQPDNAIAQMEGGIVMGISSVLQESITFKNGQVQQSNFHDYPILRMADCPESIEISLMPSSLPPTSLGELSLPLMGGAITNAFLKLTGKALRHMPFTPAKVLEVLSK